MCYQQEQQKLDHTDVDVLFTRNQHLRWILFDEVFMIPDVLLGTFASHLQDAARDSRYKQRADNSVRAFGGYNFMMFGDTLQFPPIPASTALFLPPVGKKPELARDMLSMFWDDKEDSLNYFKELTIQKRIHDTWYNLFLQECRTGNLSEEMYNYLMGFPTEHAGSWMPDGTSICMDPDCSRKVRLEL